MKPATWTPKAWLCLRHRLLRSRRRIAVKRNILRVDLRKAFPCSAVQKVRRPRAPLGLCSGEHLPISITQKTSAWRRSALLQFVNPIQTTEIGDGHGQLPFRRIQFRKQGLPADIDQNIGWSYDFHGMNLLPMMWIAGGDVFVLKEVDELTERKAAARYIDTQSPLNGIIRISRNECMPEARHGTIKRISDDTQNSQLFHRQLPRRQIIRAPIKALDPIVMRPVAVCTGFAGQPHLMEKPDHCCRTGSFWRKYHHELAGEIDHRLVTTDMATGHCG